MLAPIATGYVLVLLRPIGTSTHAVRDQWPSIVLTDKWPCLQIIVQAKIVPGIKFSWSTRNPRKFSTSKILGYTASMALLCGLKLLTSSWCTTIIYVKVLLHVHQYPNRIVHCVTQIKFTV